MIPDWKDIRKKTKKLKLSDESYFALSEEYVELKQKFQCEQLLDTLYLWFDMVIYPIYIVIRLCMLDFSAMYLLTLVKTYQLWIDWRRLQELERKVDFWKTTVRSLGGPWISSNTPELHVFVYADGMERIRHSKTLAPRPSQRTEKTSPKVEHPVQSPASSLPKSPSVPSVTP